MSAAPSRPRPSTARVKDAWDTRFPDSGLAQAELTRCTESQAAMDHAFWQGRNSIPPGDKVPGGAALIAKLEAKVRRQSATIRRLRALANELGAQLP